MSPPPPSPPQSVAAPAPATPRLERRDLALVGAGGALGTLLRATIGAGAPTLHGLPVAILAINVLGALALGALIGALAPPAPPDHPGRRRDLRLLLGTGLLGGFTTYGLLALDIGQLTRDGHPVHAMTYAAASLLLGGLAAWAGSALATRWRTRP